MKNRMPALLGLVTLSAIVMVSFTFSKEKVVSKKNLRPIPKGCVFLTVMGEEKSDSFYIFKSPEKVMESLDNGLRWLAKAQQNNGGWGAGSHSRQDILDPHAVNADPA